MKWQKKLCKQTLKRTVQNRLVYTWSVVKMHTFRSVEVDLKFERAKGGVETLWADGKVGDGKRQETTESLCWGYAWGEVIRPQNIHFLALNIMFYCKFSVCMLKFQLFLNVCVSLLLCWLYAITLREVNRNRFCCMLLIIVWYLLYV